MRLFKENKSGKPSLFHFTEAGSGEPILLLHGLFGRLSNWHETIKYFSQKYRVIIPELPVYEKSLPKEGLDGLVDYLDSFIQSLNLEKVTLVGNSLGGHLAILYTVNHPDKVERLVLAGSSGLHENSLGVTYPKRGSYQYVEEKVRNIFHNERVATPQLVDEVYEVVNNVRKTIKVIKMARSANTNNVASVLDKINVPVLLIWGKQDKVTPIHIAHRFQKLIPGDVTLHVIDQCGHVPMMEHPEEFNGVLETFLIQSSDYVLSSKRA
ncbi:alpha/beta fold hydrolase [Sporocytophaga myxococcoides]|uniref:alpha/beta fold hydrolase n=1 Tax=Sporocytophaga myxococcoides TaxID=153721 RepID=UPI0003FE8812|nr:alpha/beta hydrolase [Sporocytophaga myxococcoides]